MLCPAKESQREGLPMPVAGRPMNDQSLLQAVESFLVVLQGKVRAPEVVQRIANAVLEVDLGECAAGLHQAVNGLAWTVQI